jgi:hypothetical protein
MGISRTRYNLIMQALKTATISKLLNVTDVKQLKNGDYKSKNEKLFLNGLKVIPKEKVHDFLRKIYENPLFFGTGIHSFYN